MKKDTKCWTCKRSTDASCQWSRQLQPVDGWEAERRDILTNHTYLGRQISRKEISYRVILCPMYKWDGRSDVAEDEKVLGEQSEPQKQEIYSGPYYDAPCCLRCWTRQICCRNGYRCNERERVKEV